MTARFFLGRLVQSLLTLLAVSFLTYILIGLMPGDPVDLMAAGNPRLSPDDLARLKALHGLDVPLHERYFNWLSGALRGDFGYSRLFGLPASEVMLPRLCATLLLAGAALALTVLIATPLGVLAARAPGGRTDRFISTLSLAGMSAPAFWLGLVLISFFSVRLGWLPAAADLSDPDFGARVLSALLPVMTMVLGGIAVYVRHIRKLMISALKADHIRTARAKGCPEKSVVWQHAFGLALPSAVTLLMLDLGALFGGALTVETVFAWPGLGKLMFDAVMGNDYNLALLGFLFLTAAVLAANFLADISTLLLDPRAEERGRP